MRNVLFVGSAGFPDAETAFRELAAAVGAHALRLPDGEPPPRDHWMMWQRDVFAQSPDFELDSSREVDFGGARRVFEKYRLRPGADPAKLALGELGYAHEAVKSYAVFRRLRAARELPQGVRFQMSLPSAVAVCTQHLAPASQAAVEPAYEEALRREIARMLEAIPAEDLAIQWDVCQETLAIEGAWTVYYDDLTAGAIERLLRLSALTPEPCELGFHFCYGDPGHKHIAEPTDLSVCVALANGVSAGNPRRVNWVHMPVPKDRSDETYFRPLGALALAPETELYLGLVHLTDGLEGARRRIDAARAFRTAFGVACECGLGRRAVDTIPRVLALHAEIARL